jgi:hypothetical protein
MIADAGLVIEGIDKLLPLHPCDLVTTGCHGEHRARPHVNLYIPSHFDRIDGACRCSGVGSDLWCR